MDEAGGPISVRDIVALQRDADMASSYKPALLKALVRLVRREPSASYTRAQIGREFLSLYWNQTIVFHLRQAPSLASEPVVLREIRLTANASGARRLSDVPELAKERLVAKLANAIRIVLEKFHGSAPVAMPSLFTWESPSAVVALTEPGLRVLSDHGMELEALANLWWARYLERVNKLAPYLIRKVEREGAQRSTLSPYMRILRELDSPACFYCERPLASSDAAHVDHVLPWTFLLEDELWDLVLACVPCNLSKSDSLPDAEFIDRLQHRNDRHRAVTIAKPGISAFIHSADLYRLYDAAKALEWPGPWRPTIA